MKQRVLSLAILFIFGSLLIYSDNQENNIKALESSGVENVASKGKNDEQLLWLRLDSDSLVDKNKLNEIRQKLLLFSDTPIVLELSVRSALAVEVRDLCRILVERKSPSIAILRGSVPGGAAMIAMACDEIYWDKQARLGGELEEMGIDPEQVTSIGADQSFIDLENEFKTILSRRAHDGSLVSVFINSSVDYLYKNERLSSFDKLFVLDYEYAKNNELLYDGDFISSNDSVQAFLSFINQVRGLNLSENDVLFYNVPKNRSDLKKKEKRNVIKSKNYKDNILVIKVGKSDLVNKPRFEFMRRVIKKAESEGAVGIIFELNTPGGYAWETGDLMMKDLQDVSIKTVSYVNTWAVSAGALIAMATDEIYMKSASTIGSAAPVSSAGGDIDGTMKQKVVKTLLSVTRGVAKSKGHNPELCEAMIDESIEFKVDNYVVTNEGYVTEYRKIISPKGELLSLDGYEAVKKYNGKHLFAKSLVTSIDEVAEHANLKGDIIYAQETGFETVARFIAKISFFLIILGIAGAYLEMQSPGFGVPGFVGLVSFALFFFGNYLAGKLVGFEVVSFFILGILLVFVEIFILPGMFIFGALGVLLILGTLVMSLISKYDFDMIRQVDGFNLEGLAELLVNPLIVVIGSLVVSGFLIVFLANKLPALPWVKKLVLVGSDEVKLNKKGSNSESSKGVIKEGSVGITLTDLRPSGKVFVRKETLDVISSGDFLKKGEKVVIIEYRPPHIVVERKG